MSQKEAFLHIPNDIDGLEEVAGEVVSHPKALSDLKEIIERLRIRNEYQREKKARPGESEQIRKELAKKYHKSLSTIDTILYKWK